MFIGHFAVGFAAKRWAPRTNLAVLLAAALFADVLMPPLVLLGVEQVRIGSGGTPFQSVVLDSYPWSHSLLLTLAWAALFAGVVWLASRDRAAAVVVGIAVLSHWILDWVAHLPDLPLWPAGPVSGLGLWRSVRGTVVVETVMFAVGVALYLAATRAMDRVGLLALAALVGLLALLYVANLASPPPSSVTAMTWVGVAMSAVFLPWAWWIDRHRAPVPRS